MSNEKDKALELAIMQIEKQFGRGSIMKMGEVSAKMAVDVIPTGSLALDIDRAAELPRCTAPRPQANPHWRSI
jgi:RecA/RadA recombinase